MKIPFTTLILSILALTACTETQPAAPGGEILLPPTETTAAVATVEPTETIPVRAGPWVRTFEGPEYGAFFDIILTDDGSILAVGTTNHLHNPPYSGDAILMKLTLDGEVLWEQRWGGEGYEQAWAVEGSEDGGYFIFGETDSFGAGDRDFFLLKTDEEGHEEWYQTFGRSRREWPYGMLPLSNGDLMLYGFTEPEIGAGRKQYALRVGADGAVIWEYIGAGSRDELVADALEMEDGTIILVVILGEDAGLVKLGASGNLLWERRYELPGWQFASTIAETDDDGFLLAGFSMSSSPNRQADTWLAHCDSTGDLLWELAFGDDGFDDYAQSIIRLSDGSYLIGALANGMLLTRIDEEGNILWRGSLLGGGVQGAKAMIELENEEVLVAGFIQIVNGYSYDAIILRTDFEGQISD